MRSELARAFAELTENKVRTTRLNRQELAYLIEKISGKHYTSFLRNDAGKLNVYIDLSKRASKPKMDMPRWMRCDTFSNSNNNSKIVNKNDGKL